MTVVVPAVLVVPVMIQAVRAVPARAAVALELAPRAVLGLAVEAPAQMPGRRAMLTTSQTGLLVVFF